MKKLTTCMCIPLFCLLLCMIILFISNIINNYNQKKIDRFKISSDNCKYSK